MDLLYRIGVLSPSALLTIFPITALTILLIHYLNGQLKKQQAHGFSTSPPSVKAPLSYLLVAVVIIISVVRPYSGYDEITFKQHGGDLMFLVDISKSMLASGLQPSRMDAVKLKIIDTIDLTERSGAVARFGVTVYAGDGYTICPLTSDSAVVRQFTEFLSPDLVSNGGSNLTAGIETALDRLEPSRPTSSYILLLTDGERGIEASGIGKFSGEIPINIIGFGTPNGSSITLPNGATLRDGRGKAVISRLEEDYLRELAEKNGGDYSRATIDDSDIRHIFKTFRGDAIVEQAISTTIKVYNELGPIVAAIALLCFSVIRLKALTIVLLGVVFSTLGPIHTIRADTLGIFNPDEALEHYNKGDYAEAEERYRALLKIDATNRTAKRGLASALLKKGELSESQQLFHELAEEERSGRDFFENTFNEGNVLVAQQKYLEAIDAYNRALDVKPDDESALHNLRIARQLLENEKQNPETQNKSTKEAADKEQNHRENNAPSPEDKSREQTPSNDTNQESGASSTPDSSPSTDPSTSTADSDEHLTDSKHPSFEEQTSEQATRLKEAFVSATPQAPESLPENATPSTESTKSVPLPTPTAANSIEPGVDMPNEVKAWLESLPDSPLLIRRKQSANKNTQDW